MSDARAAILAAARVAIAARGLDGVSLDAIRRAAGASNGSLYHHFPTRAHLARALYLEALGDYQQAVMAALDRATRRDDSLRAGVAALVDAHLGWVKKRPDDARILLELREATTIDGEPVAWGEVNAGAFAALRQWIDGHVARGTMARLPFGVWLALVFAPLLQLTRAWLRGPVPTAASPVRHALIEAALGGIQAPSPPGVTEPCRPTSSPSPATSSRGSRSARSSARRSSRLPRAMRRSRCRCGAS